MEFIDDDPVEEELLKQRTVQAVGWDGFQGCLYRRFGLAFRLDIILANKTTRWHNRLEIFTCYEFSIPRFDVILETLQPLAPQHAKVRRHFLGRMREPLRERSTRNSGGPGHRDKVRQSLGIVVSLEDVAIDENDLGVLEILHAVLIEILRCVDGQHSLSIAKLVLDLGGPLLEKRTWSNNEGSLCCNQLACRLICLSCTQTPSNVLTRRQV